MYIGGLSDMVEQAWGSSHNYLSWDTNTILQHTIAQICVNCSEVYLTALNRGQTH